MFDIDKIVNDSYDTTIQYSHDCWGSSESDLILHLNNQKLKENILNEILKILNKQLQDLDRSNFDELLIIIKTIHNTKKLLSMELS